jgi:DNA repair photolyase
MLKVTEVQAKSILNKSKIFDYCLNPYTGCQVRCVYCYARLFMRRYSGHREAWGDFVDVKVNAPELLRKQLRRPKEGRVWISSVCDPYQPLEAKYRLTRKCLEELLPSRNPVTIQTKSDLILRDLDLLTGFEDVEVGFTITTDDEEIAGLFEPGASSVSKRLAAIEKIHDAGIRTFAFIGPILPGTPEKLIDGLAGKTDRVLIDRMNYMNSVIGFYRRHNLEGAATDDFFDEYRQRLTGSLRERKIAYEVVY